MLGKGPASWAEVEAYDLGLKALLRGEEVAWDGAVVGLRHGRLSGVRLPQRPPILVAAHGPKGYAVAERSADGVVTNLAHHSANTGADDMSDWMVQYYGTVLEDGEAPGLRTRDRRGRRGGGLPAAHRRSGGAVRHARMGGLRGTHRGIPVREPPSRDASRSSHRGDRPRARLLVTADLIRKATGTGTPAEVRRNLDGVAAQGVKGVLYGPMGSDIPRELEAFAETAGIVADRPGVADGPPPIV